jgi:hypothetical protein
MKNSITISAIILMIIFVMISCASQEKNLVDVYSIEKTFEFDNIPCSELFSISQKWFWNSFSQLPSSVEYEDPDKGELIAHVYMPLDQVNNNYFEESFTLYCLIKDNKSKLIIKNVYMIQSYPHEIVYDSQLERTNEIIDSIYVKYSNFITGYIKNNNWKEVK